jgi:crotonobetainyl-CoA:carnitine CoA-transferase CaiB-like acyl-CoA transferase
MNAPLSGLRIIAIEQYGAGPYGSMQLADLGAEVIKIENPAEEGDMARRVGPHFVTPNDSYFFESFNRNKRSFTLDLQRPGAREILHALAARADGMLDNLRGDLPGKLGLTYEALSAANPRIVCAHLSAYGRAGSRASWPGFDYLMQAEAGYLALTGEPEGPPARFGLSIVDLMSGLFAGFALVSGILDARATGKGRDLDVNLFDAALQNLCYLATWYLNTGHVQGRESHSAHPSIVPEPTLPDAGRLHFHHVQQGKVLADPLRSGGPPRMGRRCPLCSFPRPPCQPGCGQPTARNSALDTKHGRLAGNLCRRSSCRSGERCQSGAGESVFARARTDSRL